MAYGGRGGYGGMGGMNNMQAMMRQAQKLQEQIKSAQEEIKNTEVEGSAGGDMVTVKMTGDKRVTSVTIKPEAVDPDDVEMLEDLVSAAINSALDAADELAAKLMPAGVGGLM